MQRLWFDVRRGVATLLGWGFFGATCVVCGFVLAPLALLATPIWPTARARFADAVRALLRAYVATLLFLRVEADRRHAVPGPRILVANHQSFLDPIVLMALEPRLRGPARGYLFRAPGLGTVLETCGFYEAESGEPARLAALDDLAEGVDAEGSLLFFPEGTRSQDGAVGPFHRGAFRLAVDRGLPVQPVLIDGLHTVLPPWTTVARTASRYPVRVRFLPVIAPPFGEGYRRDVVRGLAERTRKALLVAQEEAHRARESDPPVRVAPPPPAS